MTKAHCGRIRSSSRLTEHLPRAPSPNIDFPPNPRIGAPSQAGFGPPLRDRPRQQVQGIRPA